MSRRPLTKRYHDALEKLLGKRLVPRRSRGISVVHDIERLLRGYTFEAVLDVGANVGRNAEIFLEEMRPSRLLCLEPVGSTCAQLRRNVGHRSEVKIHQLAVGRQSGSARMLVNERSVLSRVVSDRFSKAGEEANTEVVSMTTIDEFCAHESLSRVSYLKIDTEGSDLEVLQGGERMLRDQAIDFVEVEVGMNPANQDHVSMETMKRHLEERGYGVFGIYQQMHEWPTRSPRLRRVNLVFISGSLANRFSGK